MLCDALHWVGCAQDVCAQFSARLASRWRSAPPRGRRSPSTSWSCAPFGLRPSRRQRRAAPRPIRRQPAASLPVQLAVVPPHHVRRAPFQLEVGGLLDGHVLACRLRRRQPRRRPAPPCGWSCSTASARRQRGQRRPISPPRPSIADSAEPIDLVDDLVEDLSQPCDPVLQSRLRRRSALHAGRAVVRQRHAGLRHQRQRPRRQRLRLSDDECVAGAHLPLGASAGVDHVCRSFCNHDNLDDDCPARRCSTPPVRSSRTASSSPSTARSASAPCPCNPVTAAGPSGCPVATRCVTSSRSSTPTSSVSPTAPPAVGSKTDGQVCTTRAGLRARLLLPRDHAGRPAGVPADVPHRHGLRLLRLGLQVCSGYRFVRRLLPQRDLLADQ